MRVVAVDGCKAGWVAAVLSPGTDSLSFATFAGFEALLAAFADAAAITIDIPIGLCDGTRECDSQARKFIGRRASSVFPAPCRDVLSCPDYATARQVSVTRTGKSLSAQAFAIAPKIREVDDAMTPETQQRVREVHPEVCFAGLAGAPMAFPKRDSAGFEERRVALVAAMPGLPIPSFAAASRLVRGAAPDDLLDAIVAAWSATRVVDGSFATLPAEPPVDAKGLRMEMVY